MELFVSNNRKFFTLSRPAQFSSHFSPTRLIQLAKDVSLTVRFESVSKTIGSESDSTEAIFVPAFTRIALLQFSTE